MPGTRYQFAPAMTVEEAIHGTVIDFASDSLLKCSPDVRCGGNFTCLRLSKKRCEKLLFFFQCQILMPTPSLSSSLNGCHAQTVVAGDHIMDRSLGYTAVPRNLFRLAWFYQRIINDQPPLPTPGTGSVFNRFFTSPIERCSAACVTLVRALGLHELRDALDLVSAKRPPQARRSFFLITKRIALTVEEIAQILVSTTSACCAAAINSR